MEDRFKQERLQRLESRNRFIAEDFSLLYREGYRTEKAMEKLVEKYGLAVGTISKILTGKKRPVG